ncbi:hypothetical protein AKG09_02205 [Neisseria sp. 83E34]|nr:hypothetical protein AKG09_02205 [Neisseria sp. 83E34]
MASGNRRLLNVFDNRGVSPMRSDNLRTSSKLHTDFLRLPLGGQIQGVLLPFSVPITHTLYKTVSHTVLGLYPDPSPFVKAGFRVGILHRIFEKVTKVIFMTV